MISSGKLSQDESHKFKELLADQPEAIAISLGKYNVSIEQGSEIHIGDVINQSLDETSIKMLISAIREANELTDGKVYRHLQRMPLETLKVNIVTVNRANRVNSDLETVGSLDEKGYLTDSQKQAFRGLKKEIISLNEFDRKLEELHNAAKILLQATRTNLKEEVIFLRNKGKSLLDPNSLEDAAKEQECQEKQFEIIEDFIEELDDAERIIAWIDSNRKGLAKRLAKETLNSFPEVKDYIEAEKINRFCFSLYQFLEQIAHCLKWGRINILHSPGIPLVLEAHLYEKAFLFFKEVINENLEGALTENPLFSFTATSRNLTFQCIDYLIAQLPNYEKESLKRGKFMKKD